MGGVHHLPGPCPSTPSQPLPARAKSHAGIGQSSHMQGLSSEMRSPYSSPPLYTPLQPASFLLILWFFTQYLSSYIPGLLYTLRSPQGHCFFFFCNTSHSCSDEFVSLVNVCVCYSTARTPSAGLEVVCSQHLALVE